MQNAADAPWEGELTALWGQFDEQPPEKFHTELERILATPGVPEAVQHFERGGFWDSTGHEEQAASEYQAAFASGLTGYRARQATIQYASTLRNLGRLTESIALLEAQLASAQGAQEAPVDDGLDDATVVFLAFALSDVGREREAVSLLAQAMAKHLPRYQRSVRHYAQALESA